MSVYFYFRTNMIATKIVSSLQSKNNLSIRQTGENFLFLRTSKVATNIIGRRNYLRVQIIRRFKPSESVNSFGSLTIQTV